MDALTSRRSASFIAVAALALTAACSDTDQRGSITGISAATSRENRVFTQRERLGNPLVSEVMIQKSHHQEHNTGQPSTDVGDFSDDLTAFLTGVAGRDPAYANAIAGALGFGTTSVSKNRLMRRVDAEAKKELSDAKKDAAQIMRTNASTLNLLKGP